MAAEEGGDGGASYYAVLNVPRDATTDEIKARRARPVAARRRRAGGAGAASGPRRGMGAAAPSTTAASRVLWKHVIP
jgi:hypothetical protein